MAIASDYCEISEIYCTVEDSLILKELQSLFSYKLQMKREQKQCYVHDALKWFLQV